MSLKCPKCNHEATKKDYACPNCNIKFRPKPVWLISILLVVYSILNIAILPIIYGVAIFLMKNWARRSLIVAVIAQALLILLFAGFNFDVLLVPEILISFAIVIIIFVPMAIYLLVNEEVIEAFNYYGGRL